jgi:hypothetical protein
MITHCVGIYLEVSLVQRLVDFQRHQDAYSYLGEGMQERVATMLGDDLHARLVQYLGYHRVWAYILLISKRF